MQTGWPVFHRLSPESSDKLLDSTAGLLAFHIADAFPFLPMLSRPEQWQSCQQQKVDYSCGDSSGFPRQVGVTGIPF